MGKKALTEQEKALKEAEEKALKEAQEKAALEAAAIYDPEGQDIDEDDEE